MAKNRFSQIVADGHAAFNGQYKDELAKLRGLTKEEIDTIISETCDSAIYNELINVVENASKQNLTQAELIQNIRNLGEVAITIAKKVPQFSKLLK